MKLYSINLFTCRVAGRAIVAAAVIGLSGCIPTDNSFLRTAVYVMALESASQGALLAKRAPVQRDDCERDDQFFFVCQYSRLDAFLSPAAKRAASRRTIAGVDTMSRQILGAETTEGGRAVSHADDAGAADVRIVAVSSASMQASSGVNGSAEDYGTLK